MSTASLLLRAGGLAATIALVAGLATAPAIAAPAAAPPFVATPDAASASTPSTAAYKWFDKKAKSTTDPKSYWVVVNKERPLGPKSYAPTDLVSVPVAYANPPKLRKTASAAVVKMFAAFEKSTGLKMQSQSAYRSYSSQKSVYAGWVDRLGQKGADKTSARPGFSEHQTGLAIDISAKPAKCTLKSCFADTAQGKWLAKNAWKYGFILRYPKYLTKTTGYEFEPWHYRFVGVGLATEMRKQGEKTLESFFDLGQAPDYK